MSNRVPHLSIPKHPPKNTTRRTIPPNTPNTHCINTTHYVILPLSAEGATDYLVYHLLPESHSYIPRPHVSPAHGIAAFFLYDSQLTITCSFPAQAAAFPPVSSHTDRSAARMEACVSFHSSRKQRCSKCESEDERPQCEPSAPSIYYYLKVCSSNSYMPT